jgi:hypothetical protein
MVANGNIGDSNRHEYKNLNKLYSNIPYKPYYSKFHGFRPRKGDFEQI